MKEILIGAAAYALVLVQPPTVEDHVLVQCGPYGDLSCGPRPRNGYPGMYREPGWQVDPRYLYDPRPRPRDDYLLRQFHLYEGRQRLCRDVHGNPFPC